MKAADETQEKIQSEILSDIDVVFIERKLLRSIKSLVGSRYVDVSKELTLLVDMIDMLEHSR